MTGSELSANAKGSATDLRAVLLPDAPAIPGLTFRYYLDATDYATIAEIYRLCWAADQFDHTTTVDEVAVRFRPQPDYDPFTQLLFAEMEGTPVAFASVDHTQEEDGRHIYWLWGQVTPTWRRRGLGGALLQHNERRARQLAAQWMPEASCVGRVLAPDGAVGATALYKQAGYVPIRHGFGMLRPTLDDIPAAPLPPGLDVRPVQPEHYRLIWEAEQEAFRGAWGFSVAREDDYQTWLRDPLFDPSLWRIAWDGDDVVGQARNSISRAENEALGRRRGYTESISVRYGWRRRGLATALLGLSLQALKDAGMLEAALGVDVQNPNHALELYERCGFRMVQHVTTYEKPIMPDADTQ